MILMALWACEPLPCDGVSSDAPARVPRLDVTKVRQGRSEVADGFLLFNEWDADDSHAIVSDACGNPVWWSEASDPAVKVTRTRLSRDGRSVRYLEFDRDVSEDRSQIVKVDRQTGAQTITPVADGHHDFVELPDGRLAWLAWEARPNQWFDRQPRNPVAADKLMVGAEGGGDTPEILFSFFDDREPFWSCSHMYAGTFLPGHLEWTHTNSLAYDDDTGAFFLALRNWDAVLRLDENGTVAWELGGPTSDLFAGPGTVLPRHGHATELGPDRMLFFDNGNHDEDDTSRVVEYRIDEAAGRLDEVWSHTLEGHTGFLGDVRSLPGGNVLVVRPGGVIQEVERGGTVVWEARTDHTLGRIAFLPAWPPR